MSCRICKHEFCWICMGPWAEHNTNSGGFYKCNRFTADPAVTEAAKAKAELDRYLHYYQRYHGHDQALQFVVKALAAMDKRMQLMTTSPDAKASSSGSGSGSSAYSDWQHITSAAQQVMHCRRVLKYSYVLGFYLQDSSPEKQLYEYQQEMLEKHTETLQEFTEKEGGGGAAVDRSQVSQSLACFPAHVLCSALMLTMTMVDS